MFGGPLGGLLFGGETLDYFCLAVGAREYRQPNQVRKDCPFSHRKRADVRTCHDGGPVQASHPATIKLTHYPAIAA
jgi:hypothetical protein